MSKQIKKMQMAVLEKSFQGVRDMVVLNVSGLNSLETYQTRRDLRKKKIHVQVVKNSLTRLVFGRLGLRLADCWTGPTTIAWGGGSISELSREIETLQKKNKKIQVKCAVADGQQITLEQGTKMPTRADAIGRVVTLALSPARRIAGQLLGPAAKVAGQIKTISEKKEELPEAAPPAAS